MSYKWKNIQKGVFYDGHECKDVVKYWKTFLEEMKSLLLYFVEFQDDGTILHKKYPEGYIVGGLDWKPIIMITNNESIFSANDSWQKVWILERYKIFWPKRRGKGIIISDFLLS